MAASAVTVPLPSDKFGPSISRWLSVENFRQQRYGRLSSPERYECDNILGRLLMTIANGTSESEALQKAQDETKQKRLNTMIFSVSISDIIRNTEGFALSLAVTSSEIYITLVEGKNLRIPRLSSFLDNNGNPTQLQVIQSVWDNVNSYFLHRALIIENGQSWSYTLDFLTPYIEEWKLNVEAFASPFNRFLGYFCSLYPEVDHSLGNFLTSSNLPSASYMVNPPYVETIMLEMARKCIQLLNSGSAFRFFIVVPAWTDSPFYTLLKQSPYRKYERTYTRGQFKVRANTVNPDGTIVEKEIPGNFSIYIVVLDNT